MHLHKAASSHDLPLEQTDPRGRAMPRAGMPLAWQADIFDTAAPRLRRSASSPHMAGSTLSTEVPAPAAPPRVPAWLRDAWARQAWARTLAACPPEDLQAWHSLRAIDAWVRRGLAGQDCIAGVTEELTCPMHRGIMQEPYGLACGHVFEAAWLWRMVEDQPDAEEVACPSCRAKSSPVAPPDALVEILQTLRAFFRLGGETVPRPSPPPASLAWDVPGRPTRLQAAAQLGDIAWVERLIVEGVDLNAYHLAPQHGASVPPALFQAVSGGHFEVAHALIMAGALVDMPCERWSLLHEAAGRENADLDTVGLLLAAACDPMAQALGQYAIDLAREVGNDSVVSLLIGAMGTWSLDDLF